MMEATKVTERPMEAHIPQEIICATKIVIATLPLYMPLWVVIHTLAVAPGVMGVQVVLAGSDIIQEVMHAQVHWGKGQ